MQRADVRMDRAEARVDRVDRQIAGMQKIIRTGMKLIVRIEKSQKESDEKLNALIESQQRSRQREERLATFRRKNRSCVFFDGARPSATGASLFASADYEL